VLVASITGEAAGLLASPLTLLNSDQRGRDILKKPQGRAASTAGPRTWALEEPKTVYPAPNDAIDSAPCTTRPLPTVGMFETHDGAPGQNRDGGKSFEIFPEEHSRRGQLFCGPG
jgi:hypothetical protein